MKIRDKILIYFSSTVIVLLGISLYSIYLLFAEYREEDFQQQQNEKIINTIKLIEKFKEESASISYFLDQQDINDFYDEKMLIFDSNKELIFSSLDSLIISGKNTILNNLTPANNWIETKEGDYDLIGVYCEFENKKYFAISKAYDAFGYDKLSFLKNVLLIIFSGIVFIIILLGYFLANKISKPITKLAANLINYDINSKQPKVFEIETSSHELTHLTQKINEFVLKVNEAFLFQKNITHHISHQLKTPITILISELELLKNNPDIDVIQQEMNFQIIKAKSLGDIIDVLLELSKLETGIEIKNENIRIDELVFDMINELLNIYPHFSYDIHYTPTDFDPRRLVLGTNFLLLKQVVQNMLNNCILHSSKPNAAIQFDATSDNQLKLIFTNSGKPISKEEESLLFNHFFRGANSEGKSGFGLGLVLTKKILELYNAQISYKNPSGNTNIFEITFPLS
jgi:two-component system, OmpR family, sensor histidine kinase ArlS